jgi:hypothetical protein
MYADAGSFSNNAPVLRDIEEDHEHLHCHKYIINSTGNPSKLFN